MNNKAVCITLSFFFTLQLTYAQVQTVRELPPFKIETEGTMTWRVENLNVESFCNGDPIQEARSDEEWRMAAEARQPAWCFYRNDPSASGSFGRLYNWYAVNDPRGLAPLGWHVPSAEEWREFDSIRKSGLKKTDELHAAVSRTYNGQFGNTADRQAWWSRSDRNHTDGVVHFSEQGNDAVTKGNGYPVWLIRSDENHPGWKTLHVGSSDWMAENLCTLVFSNGDPVPVINTTAAWDSVGKLMQPACMMIETGMSVTVLYNWYAAKDPRKLAPPGWHLPSKDEWRMLFDTLAPGQGGALHLKDGAFNATSTGMLQQGALMFDDKLAAWWTATPMSNEIGWVAIASYVLRNEAVIQGFDKKCGLTIRLVCDHPAK